MTNYQISVPNGERIKMRITGKTAYIVVNMYMRIRVENTSIDYNNPNDVTNSMSSIRINKKANTISSNHN